MSSLKKLVWAFLAVMLLGGVETQAEISADYDEVTVDTVFNRVYWGEHSSNCFSTGCHWFEGIDPWDGLSSPCDEPTSGPECKVYGNSFCHFRILTDDRGCMLFNSRLDCPSCGNGWMDVKFTFPVGEYVYEDSTDIEFDSTSDYQYIDFYAPAGDSILLERGTTYVFEVTTQASVCDNSADELERINISKSVYIPCCSGIVGDVDGDGGYEPDTDDVDYLVAYLYSSGPEPPCLEEADINQSGGAQAEPSDITIGDVSILIDYVYYSSGTMNSCF